AGDDPTKGGSAVGRPQLVGEPAPLDAEDDSGDPNRHREQDGYVQHDGKDPENRSRARHVVRIHSLRARVPVCRPSSRNGVGAGSAPANSAQARRSDSPQAPPAGAGAVTRAGSATAVAGVAAAPLRFRGTGLPRTGCTLPEVWPGGMT